MDLKKLLGLRPKADTPAELHAALERARAALADAKARSEALKAQRAELLLHGTHDAVMGAENELREVSAEVERAEIIIPAIEAKLIAAEREELLANLTLAVAEANRKASAAAALLGEKYPLLARGIADLLHAERDAIAALREAGDMIAAAERDGRLRGPRPASLELRPLPFVTAVPKARDFPRSGVLGTEVRLPGFEACGGMINPAFNIWPPAPPMARDPEPLPDDHPSIVGPRKNLAEFRR